MLVKEGKRKPFYEKLSDLIYRILPVNMDYSGHQLFYTGLVLYYIGTIVALEYFPGQSPDDTAIVSLLMKVFRYLSYLFCLGQCFFNKYEKKHVIMYALLGISFFLAARTSGDSAMVTLFIIMLGSYKASAKTTVKLIVSLQLIFLVGHIFFSLTGVIYDTISYSPITIYSDARVRHALGFLYLVHTSFLMFFITAGLLYLTGGFSLFTGAMLVLGNIIVASLTDTGAVKLWGTLLIISGIMIRKIHYKFNLNRAGRIIISAAPFFAFITIVTVFSLYNEADDMWIWMDKALSHSRFSQGHAVLENYPLSLFGTGAQLNGHNQLTGYMRGFELNFVDSGYVYTMVTAGIVPLFSLMIMQVIFVYRNLKKGNTAVGVTLFFISMICMTETYFLNPAFNIFPLLFFMRDNEPSKLSRFYF